MLVRVDHAATTEPNAVARRLLDNANSPMTAKQIAGTIIASWIEPYVDTAPMTGVSTAPPTIAITISEEPVWV
jgi:hypothetical protein